MRLADFIEKHLPEILAQWEAFAITHIPAASGLDALELRDHAPLILQAIATDLRTPQTPQQQQAKSEGRAPVMADAPQTAAQAHGAMRARSGFDITQMVSEYRALRASVLRLWADSLRNAELTSVIGDLVRFNEAIDQAIAESVALFSEEVDRGRNLFLGVLGHELRNPLNSIQMTARYLAKVHTDDVISQAAKRLIDGGARMKALLDDLLEYSRTTLALGIPIKPAEADLAEICANVLEEIKALEPGNLVELHATGDLHGCWDAKRLHQVLSNLLLNALAYRSPQSAVRLDVTGSEGDVTFTVTNKGPTIPSDTLGTLFEPLKRGAPPAEPEGSTHLGLGLFVAREIVKAHRGGIHARSGEGETVFTVCLPRR